MSKEHSTRMFNTFDARSNVIEWVNGAGTTIARLDLNLIPHAGNISTVAKCIADLGAESIAAQAMIHGFTQKVGDSAALGIVNGRRPTWEAKSAAMRDAIDALYAGRWNAKRDSGGLLYEALQRMAAAGSAGAARILADWVGTDADFKKKLAANPKVAEIMNKIRAERAGPLDDAEFADL